jgi:unsaturated rhamnogalacturonyl hydrolase
METAPIGRLVSVLRFMHRASLSYVLAAVLLVPAPSPLAEARGKGMVPPRVATASDQPTATRKPRVLLDNYYNSEWRTDSSGVRIRYHYLWHDTANSGFSILAGIIKGLGASIDTLCRRPDVQHLKRADVYIIVDPDTPLETEHPAPMDQAAADAVARWVYRGGALVLLGNDRGNADLQTLSAVGARFGIRFNEDSRNRVVGKAFAMGTFESLPAHPMFKGVRKIYLKEISTLAIVPPARQLFADSGNVVIATARYGRGLVFAVGDPWFYDEYMDARKLPAEYDNAKAAENLFRWLLHKRWTR